jgi:hypothetical protein
MFWDITSFLLLWGAAFFSPATPLGEGITAPTRNESPVVTAPENIEVSDTRRVELNGPGTKPVCRAGLRC